MRCGKIMQIEPKEKKSSRGVFDVGNIQIEIEDNGKNTGLRNQHHIRGIIPIFLRINQGVLTFDKCQHILHRFSNSSKQF